VPKVEVSFCSIFIIKTTEFLNPGPDLDIKIDKLLFALCLNCSGGQIESKAPGQALATLDQL
jgi:hypothetical protein